MRIGDCPKFANIGVGVVAVAFEASLLAAASWTQRCSMFVFRPLASATATSDVPGYRASSITLH